MVYNRLNSHGLPKDDLLLSNVLLMRNCAVQIFHLLTFKADWFS